MWICQKISAVKYIPISKKTFAFLCCLGIIIILLSAVSVDAAAGEKEEKHVIVVLVPGLSFKEMDKLYSIESYSRLWNSGYPAAANLKPDGRYSYLNNTVTISTGRRSAGISNWNAYEKGEILDGVPAELLLKQLTGKPAGNSIIHPYFHLLTAQNHTGGFRPVPGWFGSSLEEAGINTYVIGNSDTNEEKSRFGSLLVINKSGESLGSIQAGTEAAEEFPGQLKMSSRLILQHLEETGRRFSRSFTVVEWGDLHRLFSMKGQMEQGYFAEVYEETLDSLASMLDDIHQGVSGEIWLVSPAVNEDAYKEKNELGPVWVWKEDRQAEGILYSPTTRRNGIISNTDFTASWLNAFSLEDEEKNGLGQPVVFSESAVENAGSLRIVLDRVEEINKVFGERGAVLSSYVSALIVLLIAVSLMIWFNKESPRFKKAAAILLLSGVLSPLWFLLTSPAVKYFSAYLYVAGIFAVSVLSAVLVSFLFKAPYSAACALFFTALTVDILTGAFFTERSFLSYDPVIGARYYGIGNEFAGIYLVSGILMVVPLIKRYGITSKKERITEFGILTAVSVILVVMLGSASLGANAGASLSAAIMYAFAVSQLFLKDLNRSVKLLAAGGFLLGMLGILYVLQISQPSSHIFLAYERLLGGDLASIWQTIIRKLEMNWKIFKISYWTQLFITSYFLTGIVLWKRRKGHMNGPQVFLSNVCIAGSLALLILNDSGIVAAATSMFIILSVSYGWSLEREIQSENSASADNKGSGRFF
ncbi:hypothetical protein [Evansella clarkii]|uniref:hypothetical protein n=1 Tax=Evansella clarkii TaxID=79879 RepID=UPI0009987F76|nr:hypothetical protein [Evansella clarkii]